MLDTFTKKQDSDKCQSPCYCVLLQGDHLQPPTPPTAK